jgi:hypothetical protein
MTTYIMAFLNSPMEIPTGLGSLLWVIPIGLCISVVYKAVKLETFNIKLFMREVSLLFVTGMGLMVFVMLLLLGIAKLAHVV